MFSGSDRVGRSRDSNSSGSGLLVYFRGLLHVATVLSLLLTIHPAQAYFDFPPPAHTGAPGEPTCVECHRSFSLNSGGGSFSIGGLPAAYKPGQTYNLMVSISQMGQKRWGFELSDRKSGTRTPGGTLSLTDPKFTQLYSQGGFQYVFHSELGTRQGNTDGLLNGPAQFNFAWTAPPAGTGLVSFYAAGNAANFDNTDLGDYIYSTSETVPEGTGISIAITPSDTTVPTGNSADFNANVTGIAAPQVAWNLQSTDPLNPNPTNIGRLVCDDTHDKMICGGTHVKYIAPAAVEKPIPILLIATSLDDINQTSSAKITINPQIGVAISPSSNRLAPGATVQFVPVVTGTTNTGLIWSVQDSANGQEATGGNAVVGTISASGLYTSPASVGAPLNLVIRARSQANAGIFGSATVLVADTTPPTVQFTQPVAGAYLKGLATLSASASDDASVANVSWLLDGSPIAVAPSAPYTVSWDSRTAADGKHQLAAQAVDSSGNVAVTPPITVTIDNTPPVFRKSGLDSFTFLHAPVVVTPDVVDNIGIAQVTYQLDQQKPFAVLATPPYTLTWDPSAVPDGKYTIIAQAVDLAGNITQATPAVVVIDNTPPVASLTQPMANDIVKGIVRVMGSATDANFATYALDYGSGPAPATWTPIGGAQLAPVNSGILGQWDTTALDAGLYTLRLTVTDHAGLNTTEIHAVSVVRYGDVIPDGKITIADALLALQIAIGAVTGTPQQIAAADVAPIRADGTSGDGSVDSADVLIILRMAIGLPVGSGSSP